MNKKSTFKTVILWITYAILLFFLLYNIKTVFNAVKIVIGVLTPIFIGILFAYVLNFLYEFFRKKCFHKIKTRNDNKMPAKVLALVCTYAIALGIIGFLIGILIPQLVKSGKNLFNSIPEYFSSFRNSVDQLVFWVNDKFEYDLYDTGTLTNLANKISTAITGVDFTNWLSQIVKSAFPIFINFSTGIYNWLIGLVVSIYLLTSKEVLLRQARKFIVAYTPKKFYKSFFNICTVSNKKFGKFLMGQILDSMLVGIICFIGLSILKIDYALLISFLVGVTNVIPFFGPFIGGIPSAVLLLIIDPWQCFWFVIFAVCLQQVDGNFIYPRIVGETVGIQSFWIVFSVILGGGMFGIVGMLLAVPVFATVYTMLQRNTQVRLQTKKLSDKDFSSSKDFVSKDYISVKSNVPVKKPVKFNFTHKKAIKNKLNDNKNQIDKAANDTDNNDTDNNENTQIAASQNDENK